MRRITFHVSVTAELQYHDHPELPCESSFSENRTWCLHHWYQMHWIPHGMTLWIIEAKLEVWQTSAIDWQLAESNAFVLDIRVGGIAGYLADYIWATTTPLNIIIYTYFRSRKPSTCLSSSPFQDSQPRPEIIDSRDWGPDSNSYNYPLPRALNPNMTTTCNNHVRFRSRRHRSQHTANRW